MEAIDFDVTKCVEELKQLIETKGRHIKQDCFYIWQNYFFLTTATTRMESTKLSLHESILIFQDAVEKVAAVKCSIGKKIFESFRKNISKNPDLANILIVDEYMSNGLSALPSNFAVEESDAEYYKFCLLTSVDVERSFSRFKNIFRDNRNFEFENLSKFVFINCNQNLKS